MQLEGSCHCGAVRFSVKSETPVPFMRCYCSICRKTAGGGGYAINIMGLADSLVVEGESSLGEYRAARDRVNHPDRVSSGQRRFCTSCGSALWVFDPSWPEFIYPFASAIDTPLPAAPAEVHIMENYRPDWADPSAGPTVSHFPEYPEEAIIDWHRRNGLLSPGE